MTQDILYIFDKKTLVGSILGEVQNNFNMSFVIDGTKDSCSVVVHNFQETEVEPYSIVQHVKTNTWWIISHDKVERYQNDNNDFLYVHNLELLGAIDLLNARDLTDCGFNDNTYTVREFIERLCKLSNFEFTPTYDLINPILNQKVNFIKTFENYTLLSALREFLDSYNCSIKLDFVSYESDDVIYLSTNAIFKIISKTGNYNLTTHTMSYFDDVRETKTMSKESFGACVVSNAENVISSIAKTYPSVGGVKFSADTHNIVPNNAVLRLPSNVFKANWLAVSSINAPITISGGDEHDPIDFSGININPWDEISFDVALEEIVDRLQAWGEDQGGTAQEYVEETTDFLLEHKNTIWENIKLVSTIKFYNGNELNAFTGGIVKGSNVPYIVHAFCSAHGDNDENQRDIIFCDMQMKKSLEETWRAFAWERGKNTISGFDLFGENTINNKSKFEITNAKYTEFQIDVNLGNINIVNIDYGVIFEFHIQVNSPYSIYFKDSQWKVNYIPMSDLKIKVDNRSDKKDIQLYNQNGKITDNFALSKLLNSYSQEISGDNITKFKTFYDFTNIPSIGSMVYNSDNEPYVINNISLTFTQNEDSNYATNFGYQIDCEFTMSKYTAVKSLLTNPNTNIRDYGIPQNFNVKRKQLYRDFYELTYVFNEDHERSYYLYYKNIFVFDHQPNEAIDYIAVMKLTYENNVNGSRNYYYQLESVVYNLNKMLYVNIDFNDNNIIGYCSQNVYSGFVISRIFTGQTDTLNTPISYVDENGRFKDIDILLCSTEQIMGTYYQYKEDNSGESGYSSYTGSLYNESIFIPADIYNDAYSTGNYKIRILEENYNKDALEVPVFEYAVQADDTTDVLIGDGIFAHHNGNYVYLYSYNYGQNLVQENVSPQSHIIIDGRNASINNSADITNFGSNWGYLLVKLYESNEFTRTSFSFENGTQQAFTQGIDYAFFRHVLNLTTMEEESVELLFIAKKIPSDALSNANKELTICLNHYKLN